MNEALDKKIESLKPAKGFTVAAKDRVKVLQRAVVLRAKGKIAFDVVTKACGDSFKVRAI